MYTCYLRRGPAETLRGEPLLAHFLPTSLPSTYRASTSLHTHPTTYPPTVCYRLLPTAPYCHLLLPAATCCHLLPPAATAATYCHLLLPGRRRRREFLSARVAQAHRQEARPQRPLRRPPGKHTRKQKLTHAARARARARTRARAHEHAHVFRRGLCMSSASSGCSSSCTTRSSRGSACPPPGTKAAGHPSPSRHRSISMHLPRVAAHAFRRTTPPLHPHSTPTGSERRCPILPSLALLRKKYK